MTSSPLYLRWLLLIATCFTTVAAWPQQNPKPSPTQATAVRPASMGFSDLAISPDGHRVAWVSGDEIMVEDLAQPTGPPHAVAHGAVDIWHHTDFSWSPDSRRIAFVSGDDYRHQQLFVVDANGGSARQLTNVQGALTRTQWSPDGKTVSFLLIENPPRIPGAASPIPRQAGQWKDVSFVQRLALVDLASGKMRLISPADLYIWEYDWSPDSRRFIVNAAAVEGDNGWYFPKLDSLDAASGELTVLLKPDMQVKNPCWSPDGKQIAFIGGIMAGDPGEIVANYGDVYLMPATGVRARNLTPKWKASASRITWLSPDQILIRDIIDGDVGLATLEMSGVTQQLWKGADFSPQGGRLDDISLARDHRTSVVVLRSLETPPEIWLGSIGAWSQFTHFNDGVHLHSERVESLHWQSDQWRIQGWLTYPRNYDPRRQYPMVAYIHGGPSGLMTATCGQEFAAAGYFVLCPNFRGSAGFGEDFLAADVRDLGYGDLRDIVRGVEQVLKTFPVDRNRIGITGHSYGGYMSMWAVTQTDLFHASVASGGISDWLSYVGEADVSNWVVPYFRVSIYDDPAIYTRSAPMTYIKNVKTPTLVIVGADDGECPATQSIEFWRALKTLGVKTELVLYPGVGHAIFISREAVRDRSSRTIKWFDEYLK